MQAFLFQTGKGHIALTNKQVIIIANYKAWAVFL